VVDASGPVATANSGLSVASRTSAASTARPIARRTSRSSIGGFDTTALRPNTTPGLGRETSSKPPWSSVSTSWGGTPPMTPTWPDVSAPVRTLASGMIWNSMRSRWAAPSLDRVSGAQA
jgi:hypothetical protein